MVFLSDINSGRPALHFHLHEKCLQGICITCQGYSGCVYMYSLRVASINFPIETQYLIQNDFSLYGAEK